MALALSSPGSKFLVLDFWLVKCTESEGVPRFVWQARVYLEKGRLNQRDYGVFAILRISNEIFLPLK